MVDFGALPPEVNSARMYMRSRFVVVPGCRVGMERPCRGTPVGCSGLRDGDHATVQRRVDRDRRRRRWQAPHSRTSTWLQQTAAQAEQAATQARRPLRHTSRRSRRRWRRRSSRPTALETAAAVQANVFGQYTPLIAQLEAQYGEMWAQDAAAMYSYAGQSASAAQVTPFATPAATTNPGGTATQAAAVSQATGTSAASSSQSILQQLTSSMPSSLQSLASPAATSAATTAPQRRFRRSGASYSGRPSCPQTSRRW